MLLDVGRKRRKRQQEVLPGSATSWVALGKLQCPSGPPGATLVKAKIPMRVLLYGLRWKSSHASPDSTLSLVTPYPWLKREWEAARAGGTWGRGNRGPVGRFTQGPGGHSTVPGPWEPQRVLSYVVSPPPPTSAKSTKHWPPPPETLLHQVTHGSIGAWSVKHACPDHVTRPIKATQQPQTSILPHTHTHGNRLYSVLSALSKIVFLTYFRDKFLYYSVIDEYN